MSLFLRCVSFVGCDVRCMRYVLYSSPDGNPVLPVGDVGHIAEVKRNADIVVIVVVVVVVAVVFVVVGLL